MSFKYESVHNVIANIYIASICLHVHFSASFSGSALVLLVELTDIQVELHCMHCINWNNVQFKKNCTALLPMAYRLSY
jgi:hypothetical protein